MAMGAASNLRAAADLGWVRRALLWGGAEADKKTSGGRFPVGARPAGRRSVAERPIIRAMLGTAMVLIMMSPNVLAAESELAVEDAIALCLSSQSDIAKTRAELTTLGWKASENAAFDALLNSKFAFYFDGTNINETFRNAAFMAGSILGNSSLGADQISMEFADVRLAFLGINENSQYCVFAGPETLLDAIRKAPGYQELIFQKTENLTQIVVSFRDVRFGMVSLFDLERLKTTMEAQLDPSMVSETEGFMQPATIFIARKEVLQ